jgi:catechol 2,3-dioxygenase-like lactoylglutathione lyase family enzyme
MALHRLTHITVGVPDPAAVAGFYRDFGLEETAPGRFSTADGGEQLRLLPATRRGLVELGLGVDHSEDLARIVTSLAGIGVRVAGDSTAIQTYEPVTGLAVSVTITPRLAEPGPARPACNAPGRVERANRPADGVLRDAPVRPAKLSHVAIASPDHRATTRFFTEGLGFAVSDAPPFGTFMRCSEDHHNLAVQEGPGTFLHHTAWEVADVDEVGRGGSAMVGADPARHVWGLGRHAIGSNFFWYLCDPAGNFAEYVSDLDRITDADAYAPPSWSGMQYVRAWSPPLPPEFLMPKDVPELLA